MSGLEPVGIAAVKSLVPKAAMAAWKHLHPNDWQRRLAKAAVDAVRDRLRMRISKKLVRKWLSDPDNEPLLEAVIVHGADGATDEARQSIDATLQRKRSWRKASEVARIAAITTLLDAVAGRIISSLDPSEATDAAARRTGAKIEALRSDVLDRNASISQAEFDLAVQAMSAPTMTALRELAQTSSVVSRVVAALGDHSAEPRSLIPYWLATPPGWLVEDAPGWAALGVLAEELLFVDLAVDAWVDAVNAGSAEPGYWSARAAWLLFEQTLPEEDQSRVVRARTIMAPFEHHAGESPFITTVRSVLQDPDHDVADDLRGWTDVAPRDVEVRGRVAIWSALNGIIRGRATWADAEKAATGTYESARSPRVGLMLSRITMGEAVAVPTPERTRSLVHAYELSLSIRDQLRAMRAPSLPAVHATVEIAQALTDPSRVLRAGTDWPEFGGDANDSESHETLIAPAVVLAALTLGALDRARSHAASLPPGYARNLCAAYVLEADGSASAEQRRAAWFDVLAAADSVGSRLPAWRGLAQSGADELPGMHEELDPLQPGLAASLDAMTQAARGFHDLAERTLLPFARSDVHAAQQLATVYQDQGQDKVAARTLNQAGLDFHDPDLQLRAAEALARIGEVDDAKAIFDRLVAGYGDEWSGRASALRGAGWAARASDRPEQATDLLRSAVRLDPDNANGRWHLVQVLCQRGLTRDAWSVIAQAPEPLQVRTVDDARAWLEACLRGGPAGETFISAGLDFMDQFPDDERFAASVLGNSMVPTPAEGAEEPLPDPLRQRLNVAFAAFFEKWPSSAALHRLEVPDDPEQLRALLDSQSQHPTEEQSTSLSNLVNGIQAGQLPIAVLAGAVGKPVLQMLIERATGPLVCTVTDYDRQGLQAARAALNKDVVIDSSALHVAADISASVPGLRGTLAGVFRDVSATEATGIDLAASVERLQLRSPGIWVPGSQGSPGYFSSISSAAQERIARSVENLLAFRQHYRLVATPAATPLFDRDQTDNPQMAIWMRSLQLAHDLGVPVWSDEAATRSLARGLGIAAFSTRDLLVVLSQGQQITDVEINQAAQHMLDTGLVDYAVTAEMLRRAASGDAAVWARSAIARPAQWMNNAASLERWATFVRAVPSDDRPTVPHWTFAAVTGALKVPYVFGAAAARHTVARIVAMAVFAHASSPRIVADCVGSMREATSSAALEVDDPLPLIVQLLRDAFLRRISGDQVTSYITAVFSSCSEHDKSTVRRSLLR